MTCWVRAVPCVVCVHFVSLQRKQLLETQLRQLNERIAELEEAIRIADGTMAPLHQQVDDLQKRKQELQAETNQKAAA